MPTAEIVTGTRPAIVEALELGGFAVDLVDAGRGRTDYVCTVGTLANVVVRVNAKGQIQWAEFWALGYAAVVRVTGVRLVIGAVVAFLACRCSDCLNPYA